MTRYSIRKINALQRAGAVNVEEEMKRLSKAVGIGARYGFNADNNQFNSWLREK